MTDANGATCKAAEDRDLICRASDPCALHGCDDTDDGCTAEGCYCDPARRPVQVLPSRER